MKTILNSKKRNSNIELLRIMLMLSIIGVHVCNYCIQEYTFVRLFVAVLMAWNVDCFMIISGWYGIRFNLGKFIRLWGQIAFYSSLAFVGCMILFPTEFSLKDFCISGGWFGGSYLSLMLVAPFLNAGIEAVCSRGKRYAALVWGGGALVMVMTWTPYNFFTGIDATGLEKNLSFCTLAFVYVTGRILRLLQGDKIISRIYVIMGCSAFLLTIAFLGFSNIMVSNAEISLEAWKWKTTYNAPHVWCMAAIAFLYVDKYVRLPNMVGAVCNFISPSVFAIYLFHAGTPCARYLTKWFVQQLTPYFQNDNLFFMWSIVIVFSIGLGIDFCRRLVIWFCGRMFTRIQA